MPGERADVERALDPPRRPRRERCARPWTPWVFAIAILLCANSAVAEEAIGRYAFSRDVVAREPVGEATVFPADVGRVYFFTQITGAAGETEVRHVWFHGDREVASVSLPVEGYSWRTWSSKEIPPDAVGEWSVEVRDANGVSLLRADFRVE